MHKQNILAFRLTLVIRTYTKISCANAGKFDLPHALRILKIRNADKNTKICRAERVNWYVLVTYPIPFE